MSLSSTLLLPPQGWHGTEIPALDGSSSVVDQWFHNTDQLLSLSEKVFFRAADSQGTGIIRMIPTASCKTLILHIRLLTADDWSFKMQSHSAVCALECQTVSWAGSSHCSTAAPLMCLWESASFKLELPNIFSGEKGDTMAVFPWRLSALRRNVL